MATPAIGLAHPEAVKLPTSQAHLQLVSGIPEPQLDKQTEVDVVSEPAPQVPSGKESLMSQAGIPQSEWAAVDYVVTNESGWNPNATNVSSGAHGLPQALPYSKTGCGWEDGICQLVWATSYAYGRYGGWWAAQAFWAANHWW